MDEIARLFSFKGRTKRLNYWAIHFACIAIIMAAWLAGDLLAALTRVGLSFGAWNLVLGFLIGAFVSLAATTRRLHDRNKSAWWLVLFIGVPMIGRIFALLLDAHDGTGSGNPLISVIFLPMSLWALVELGVLRGTRGANRYGEDPLESGAADPQPITVVS